MSIRVRATVLSTLVLLAPAALADGAKVTNNAKDAGSWFLVRHQEHLLADQPELAVTWLCRSEAGEAKEDAESLAGKVASGSGLEVRKGEAVALDFGKCGVADEIWIKVTDRAGSSKLSIRLTRVRSEVAGGEARTMVTFHPAAGEADVVGAVAEWGEDGALTLTGGWWPSS
jgi:hypothetical protein